MTPTARSSLLFAIAFLCAGGLAFALYSQYVLGLLPCAWCILQRLMLIAILVLCVLGGIVARQGHDAARIVSGLAALGGLAGVAAGYYQHTVAAESFSCDLSLADRIVTGSGLDQAVPEVFSVQATCADASVALFGVAYEVWAMVLFVVVTVGLLLATFRRTT